RRTDRGLTAGGRPGKGRVPSHSPRAEAPRLSDPYLEISAAEIGAGEIGAGEIGAGKIGAGRSAPRRRRCRRASADGPPPDGGIAPGSRPQAGGAAPRLMGPFRSGRVTPDIGGAGPRPGSGHRGLDEVVDDLGQVLLAGVHAALPLGPRALVEQPGQPVLD